MKLYTELAEYYFSIEENHRDISDDVSFVRSILLDESAPALLDIGCGTGEHLNILSRYGITCTGLDSSPKMLEIARTRQGNRIKFIDSDMRDFDMYEEFDMAISLFGSMNYLVDDSEVDRTFWNIWRALKPGGRLLIELWNSYPIEIIREKEISRVSLTQFGNIQIERERGFRKIDSIGGRTVCEVNYIYHVHKNGATEEIRDRHIMRSFSMNEIEPFIRDNGFVIENVYSSVLKEPVTPRSKKMIFLCTKE